MPMRDSESRPEAQAAVAEQAARPRRKSQVREYSEAIIVAVLLALVIRAFVVQAFTIPSGSMMDTLLVGDYILVNKFLFGPEIPFTDTHLPGLRAPSGTSHDSPESATSTRARRGASKPYVAAAMQSASSSAAA